MNSTQLFLTNIIQKVLRTQEEIEPSVSLHEYGMQSIDLIKIVVKIEQYLKIEILDSELSADNFDTIERIEETIKKYLFFRDGQICKSIILDCDGILWNGIAGEAGDDFILLTNLHYKLFSILHRMRESGWLLCLCTENSQSNIERVLEKCSPLTINDFVISCFNSEQKRIDVQSIIHQTGFSPIQVLFVDDSQRICLDLEKTIPNLNTYCVTRINNLIILLNRILSSDKSETHFDRTEQFRMQIEREKLKQDNIEQYNNSLETKIECSIAQIEDASRISNLSQRANRFNLTGNHLDEVQIRSIITAKDNYVFKLKVKDRFGDMGIVAFLVINNSVLKEFVLSCRAFNRGFEDYLLKEIQKRNIIITSTDYSKTEMNLYCEDFLKRNKLIDL